MGRSENRERRELFWVRKGMREKYKRRMNGNGLTALIYPSPNRLPWNRPASFPQAQ